MFDIVWYSGVGFNLSLATEAWFKFNWSQSLCVDFSGLRMRPGKTCNKREFHSLQNKPTNKQGKKSNSKEHQWNEITPVMWCLLLCTIALTAVIWGKSCHRHFLISKEWLRVCNYPSRKDTFLASAEPLSALQHLKGICRGGFQADCGLQGGGGAYHRAPADEEAERCLCCVGPGSPWGQEIPEAMSFVLRGRQQLWGAKRNISLGPARC